MLRTFGLYNLGWLRDERRRRKIRRNGQLVRVVSTLLIEPARHTPDARSEPWVYAGIHAATLTETVATAEGFSHVSDTEHTGESRVRVRFNPNSDAFLARWSGL